MAVRPQHMHDGGVVERRLRPIYDWLDYGNNKKALQEAEKVLKKSPSLQAARALKALALLRLGRGPDAHAVLDALVEEKPSDDTTLQAMTISYRESQQLQKVCALYEAAVKSEPSSEELHSHLFMSYVRVGDYRAQQRAAMALYKFAPKNPYYFWAVMSIVLQAKESEDSSKKNILLSLAQRMVDNFISENKMEAEQEARLYIMILELQEKYSDILKFIDSPLYAQLVPGSNAQARIPYLKRLGHWRELNILCKELLYENQDRWDFYLPYLDSVFALMNENSNEETTADDTAEKCHEFICQLVESMANGRTLRGPYLARLELWKRLSKDGDPTALLGSGVALCVQYLRVFAQKPYSVPDLRPYLSMLDRKEREDHSRDFLTCLGFDENSQPDTLDDIQRHLSCLAAWRITAPVCTPAQSLSLARMLRANYLRCLDKGLVTATLTEFCAADSYGVLAAHMYCNAAIEQQVSAPVLEALSLLELVLHHSPANYHVKLLLVTMYHLLGSVWCACASYSRLECKHVQLVSLWWVHGARVAAAAAAAHHHATAIAADATNFHKHHTKDSVDHLTYAYKYGTFEKLVELYAWRARLEQCACALAAARAGDAHAPTHAQPLPELLTDNRDLNVIVNYDPPHLHDPELKQRTFDQDVAFLRLKDAIVTSIALCVELAENKDVETKEKHYEELTTCLDAFSKAMEKCKEKYCVKERISISAPFPSRIIAFVSSPVPYRELYPLCFSLCGAVCVPRGRRPPAPAGALAAALARARDELRVELAGHGDPGYRLRGMLESITNYLEFIGIVTHILGVCYNHVTPPGATKKSKKKTNQSPEETRTKELLNQINSEIQNSLTYLENVFDNLPNHEANKSLEDELSKLSLKDYQDPVEKKMKDGHTDMVNEVKEILKNKLKYLNSLQ